MARKTPKFDFSPVLNAARLWIDKCLIDDQAIFTNEQLWTLPLAQELDRVFNQSLDESEGKFLEKLSGQLQPASPASKRLMTEILWALCLFPSQSRPPAKRTRLFDVWKIGGTAPVDEKHPMLSDAVLSSIGSAGTAYSTHHWREVRYLILLLLKLKALPKQNREAIFASYGQLADWLETMPDTASRQFPHMLRYFAFPDQVERISSSDEKRKILTGFGIAPQKNWNSRKFDEELLSLRQRLEQEFPDQSLDFYEPPLVSRWKKASDSVPTVNEDAAHHEFLLAPAAPLPSSPTNLILYGPPGTGKTYELQTRQKIYTEIPQAQNRSAWLQALLVGYGWRSVIAVALKNLGPKPVPEIRAHELVQAKAVVNQRNRNLSQTISATLQQHTPEMVGTVQFKGRRSPFIFTKSKEAVWSLLGDWTDSDDEAAELARIYAAGPVASSPPIKRFRQVTFHPSFSYEDFVRGIRPVASDDDGRTEFRLVDGVFKQICDEARANPSKRYALFIDEINRGNIAKIFGELITLIEADKRLRLAPDGSIVGGMAVQLPGSGGEVAEPPFGVPANLDLYGTMNTADRSIALLDIALRRRFEFREMEPRYDLLAAVGKIDCAALLRRINDRLEYLLDRDRRIGHAYVMKAGSLDDLRKIFAAQIIPLLQEYFFDDLAKVALTLSVAGGSSPFVEQERFQPEQLFPGARHNMAGAKRERFTVTSPADWTEDDFMAIYSAPAQVLEEEETEES